jgi:hypothetical protein
MKKIVIGMKAQRRENPYSAPAKEYVAIPLASFPELVAMSPGPKIAAIAARRSLRLDGPRRDREGLRVKISANFPVEKRLSPIFVATVAVGHRL